MRHMRSEQCRGVVATAPPQTYWQVHSSQAQQVYPAYYRDTKVVGTLYGGRAIHLTTRYPNDRVSGNAPPCLLSHLLPLTQHICPLIAT